MGDRASHCCCGGCELWTATLPANADTSDPPEGFVYSAPTWKLIDTLPGTDVRLRFDPSKSNPSQLTLTQPNSGQILRFTLSPLNDPELEFQQQLTFERGTAEQLTPIILDLESQFYRVPFLDLWISDGHLQLSSLSRMFTGEAIWDDGDFSSLEILENTTTGKSFDLSTFLRIDSDDDPKTKQWGTFSITVPIESDGSRWEVSFEVDTPESEATFIASRASTIAGTARFDCPKAPACSANSPHYGAVPFDVNLILNGPVASANQYYRKLYAGTCGALAHIAYNESYPMDTLSDADLAERLNMGTFVGTREDRTGWTATEFENPANYDDSFPVRPSRHYSGEPRIFDASVEAVLLAKSDVSMTLRIHVIIDGFFVSNPPPPTDAGYWFTPTAASFGGTNYSSVLINSKSWPLQSRDFPADTSLIRGIAGVSNGGKGLHFNFGVYFPSTILRTSLSHQFETEVGLLSNPDDVITIPLSGHVPSNPMEVVAGEHVEVTATRVQPENFSNRYVVQYHVVQSHDRLPFDLADQTVEIKPFNGLPFVN